MFMGGGWENNQHSMLDVVNIDKGPNRGKVHMIYMVDMHINIGFSFWEGFEIPMPSFYGPQHYMCLYLLLQVVQKYFMLLFFLVCPQPDPSFSSKKQGMMPRHNLDGHIRAGLHSD